jgi:hypothetical protein
VTAGDRFFRFLIWTAGLLLVFIVAVQIGIHQGRALATSNGPLEYRLRLNLSCDVTEPKR